MQCKKARTFYMLMVQYNVVGEEDGTVETPCLRNPPARDPMSYMPAQDMEACAYINKEEAEAVKTEWIARFPQAAYSIMEVTPR